MDQDLEIVCVVLILVVVAIHAPQKRVSTFLSQQDDQGAWAL